MKIFKIFAPVIFIFSIAQTVWAQDDTGLDFYPYHVGDIRQYVTYPSGNFTSDTITRIDTVNTNTHDIFWNNDSIASLKIVVDSAIVLVDPDYWYQYYKLNYPVSSIWIRDTTTSWWVHYKSVYPSQVFNESRMMREYHVYEFTPGDTTGLPGSVEYLVEGIGHYRSTWEGGELILTGCIINGIQYGTIVNIDEESDVVIPDKINLKSYPNPFNAQTNLVYSLPIESNVMIKIYNNLGELVELLYDGVKATGEHLQVWNADNKTTGVYFAVLRVNNQIKTIKLLYLK
jgi:hypothetical protein